jgi:hypothetical protein
MILKTISFIFLTVVIIGTLGAPLYLTWPTYFDTGLWLSAIIFILEVWLISGIIVQMDRDFPNDTNIPRIVLEISKFVYVSGIISYFITFSLIVVGAVWGAWQDRYTIIQFVFWIGLIIIIVFFVWLALEQIFKRRT